MRKIASLLSVLLLLCTLAFAQSRTVTGTVKDENGDPIPYATITETGTRNATTADASGSFTINVKEKSSLTFSSAGFQTQTLASPNGTIAMVLPRGSQLQEVVVTALGISRAQRSLGYATSQIKGEEITKARETNVINSLAGKVSGVRITSQSGTLGGASKIIIRGQSSFSDASGGQPIFVVDGLPIDNGSQQLATAPSAVPQGTAGVDFGNRAGDINPDDIESINVLKGAAATALYGARAKNGAIIITTKRGKKGASTVRFNSSVRFDSPLRLPDFQNEYAQGTYGVYSVNNTSGWGPKISDVQDVKYPNFMNEQVTLKAYPDNVKDFYQTGHTYMNSIAFESGGESGDFRFGYTNNYQTGIIEKEKFLRNSLSLNVGRAFSSKVDLRASLNYVNSVGKNRPFQSSNNSSSLTQIINFMPRTVDMNQLRANYVDSLGQQIPLVPNKTGNNPYWVIYNNKTENNVDRIYGNAVLSYKPFSWLTITDNFGTDLYNEFRKLVVRPGTAGALQGNFFQANIFNRTLNNDLIATAEKKVNDDLGLKVLAGVNNFETFYRRDQADAQQLTVDELYTFSNAATVTNSNTSNKKRIIGVFGEIGLSYKNFLFVNATGRNDWSSTLPVENRSYFYPSIASSFIFTEVIPASNILSYGKLRASWANVGSGTDPYQLAFDYSAVSQSFAQYGQGSQFPFNGVLGFTIPSTIPNAKLKPQNQQSYEAGVDLKFFKDRARVEFTYYNTKTADQIIALALPQSTGFAAKRINAGAIKNVGIELTVGGRPISTKDFNWNIDFNFSKNKQTVEDLPTEIKQYTLASAYNALQIRARNGEQLGLWGTAFERDSAGDYVINPNTGLRKVVTDQRLGNVYPDWMLGINNSFNYKGLNLSFLIDIRKGGVLYSGTVAGLRSSGLGKETLLNRGDILIDKGVVLDANGKYVPNTIPVQSMQDYWGQFGNSTASESAIFDASYVKLREVALAYSLPARWFSARKFVKGLSVGFEGRNLWLIDAKIPHIDPEVNLFGTATVGEGVEFYNIPSSKSFGVNLRATF